MAPRRLMLRVVVAALPALLAGCFDEPPLPESGVPIFTDGFAIGFTPNSFDPAQGADPTALSVDKSRSHAGTASIRIDVPASSAGYAGGAVLADKGQDLTRTNALVFWAMASRAAVFDMVGFGLEFDPYPSTYLSTLLDLPLTTEWTRHLIPIANPAKVTSEHGMFFYVDVAATGYSAWFDDVKFDTVDPATMALQPAVLGGNAIVPVGASESVPLELKYTDFDGTQRSVDSGDNPGSGPAPEFFSFTSSDPSVATVDPTGTVHGLLVGQASITARLGGAPAAGALTVDVVATAPTAPATLAPTPAPAPGDVVSLYNSSKVYTDVFVSTWQASWSSAAAPATYTIPATTSVVKKYATMQYAGVEALPAPHVNASAMTYMHVDVWTPNAPGLGIKLVGFSGTTAGAEAQVDFGSSIIKKYRWVSLEIPLTRFAGVDLSNIGQLVWVNPADPATASNGTYFIDNVYFHR
jgi:hypothetical protein